MKANKNQFTIVLISLIILCFLWVFYMKQNTDDNQVNVEIAGTSETMSVDESLILSDAKTYTTAAATSTTLPDQFQLNVPFISQHPELPTGCEITALTEALAYYGFEEDKQDLARRYLRMDTKKTTGCFIEYFLGSPWSERGIGCFAPTITNAANAYLKDVGSSLQAYTLSYNALNSLFSEVASGHPVIIWTSSDYSDTDVSYNEIPLDNGQTFSWPENEHCVVLSGYDLKNKTVTIADPTDGIVVHDLNQFTYFYQKYFYQAVVIK